MKTSTGLLVALLVFAVAGIGTLGCNTFRGAGKDIERGGRAVEKAADNAQYPPPRPIAITALADSGGSISPSGITSRSYGMDRTFTIRADRGHHVADVLVDGRSVGAVSRYTFDRATDNHTISAVFTSNPRRY